MDAQQTALARACLAASYDGSMDFPAVVGALIEAGFEGYAVDYGRGATTYYRPDGETLDLANPPSDGAIAPTFDAAQIQANIRAAQANGPDYTYLGFCKAVKAAGCAGYHVSFPGRRAVYFGRTGETHVEHFPQ